MSSGVWDMLGTSKPPSAHTPSFVLFDEPKTCFTGRTEIIQDIHRRLLLCSTQSSYLQRIVVLTGAPGIGKSEIARHYAKVYLRSHLNVMWINASSESSLKASFLALGHRLNICEYILKKSQMDSEDLKTLVWNIYHYFSDHIRCGLFIFDDSVQMRSKGDAFGIFDYLPKQPFQHLPLILITSQNREWGSPRDGIQTVKVDAFDLNTSLQFLSAFFPLPKTQVKKLEEQYASLAGSCHGHPMALDLAASNIAHRVESCSSWQGVDLEIRRYIHFQNRPHPDWVVESFPDANAANNDSSIFSAFTKCFDRIQTHAGGPTAIDLLNLIAYLDRRSVTIKLCSAICENARQNVVGGKLEFEDASESILRGFQLLEKFSLVQCENLSMGSASKITTLGIIQKCTRDILATNSENLHLFKILNYFQSNPLAIIPFSEHVKSVYDAVRDRRFPDGTMHHSIFFAVKLMNRGGKFREIGWEMLTQVQDFVQVERSVGAENEALLSLALKVAEIFGKRPYSSDPIQMIEFTLDMMRLHENDPWIQDVGINFLDRFFYRLHHRSLLSRTQGDGKTPNEVKNGTTAASIMNAFMTQNGVPLLVKQLSRWIGAKETENSLYYHILSLIRFLSFEGGYTRSFVDSDDFLRTFKETTRRATETPLKNLKYWTFLTWFALFARTANPNTSKSIRFIERTMTAWQKTIPQDHMEALTEWKLEYDDCRNDQSDADILAAFLSFNDSAGVAHECAYKLKQVLDLSLQVKKSKDSVDSSIIY